MDNQEPFSCRLEERWIPPKEWKKVEWDEFITEHTGLIFGVCKKMLHDVQHAEDAMQETFIKIFNDAYKFKYGGYEQFCAWAVKTAERKCSNIIRKQKVMRKLEEKYSGEYKVRNSLMAPLDLKVGDEIDFARVREHMPEIVRLKHIEGFTHEEIAEKLGITVKSAKSMLSIAMKELKEQLRKYN